MPSPNRICMDTVGCPSSISIVDAAGWDGIDTGADVVGAVVGSVACVPGPGVGLPSRWPPPPNALYFFFGTT